MHTIHFTHHGLFVRQLLFFLFLFCLKQFLSPLTHNNYFLIGSITAEGGRCSSPEKQAIYFAKKPCIKITIDVLIFTK